MQFANLIEKSLSVNRLKKDDFCPAIVSPDVGRTYEPADLGSALLLSVLESRFEMWGQMFESFPANHLCQSLLFSDPTNRVASIRKKRRSE